MHAKTFIYPTSASLPHGLALVLKCVCYAAAQIGFIDLTEKLDTSHDSARVSIRAHVF